jgi:hypothetical protein
LSHSKFFSRLELLKIGGTANCRLIYLLGREDLGSLWQRHSNDSKTFSRKTTFGDGTLIE